MNYEEFDTIFSNLKIIGKLEPGEKIIFIGNSIEVIDFSTYNLGRVKKWYHDETRVIMRQKLKEFYRDIESKTVALILNPISFIEEWDIDTILSRLMKDLKGSTKGINNLILTYNEDKTTRSELETLNERIQIIISKIEVYFASKSGHTSNKTSKSVSTNSTESSKKEKIKVGRNKSDMRSSVTAETLSLSESSEVNLVNSLNDKLIKDRQEKQQDLDPSNKQQSSQNVNKQDLKNKQDSKNKQDLKNTCGVNKQEQKANNNKNNKRI